MISNVSKYRSSVSSAMWGWVYQIRDREQLRRPELLEQVPLFTGRSHRQLGKLLARFYEKGYAAGETIFVEGDAGKALFIVFKGRVSIWRATDAGQEMLAILDP